MRDIEVRGCDFYAKSQSKATDSPQLLTKEVVRVNQITEAFERTFLTNPVSDYRTLLKRNSKEKLLTLNSADAEPLRPCKPNQSPRSNMSPRSVNSTETKNLQTKKENIETDTDAVQCNNLNKQRKNTLIEISEDIKLRKLGASSLDRLETEHRYQIITTAIDLVVTPGAYLQAAQKWCYHRTLLTVQMVMPQSISMLTESDIMRAVLRNRTVHRQQLPLLTYECQIRDPTTGKLCLKTISLLSLLFRGSSEESLKYIATILFAFGQLSEIKLKRLVANNILYILTHKLRFNKFDKETVFGEFVFYKEMSLIQIMTAMSNARTVLQWLLRAYQKGTKLAKDKGHKNTNSIQWASNYALKPEIVNRIDHYVFGTPLDSTIRALRASTAKSTKRARRMEKNGDFYPEPTNVRSSYRKPKNRKDDSDIIDLLDIQAQGFVSTMLKSAVSSGMKDASTSPELEQLLGSVSNTANQITDKFKDDMLHVVSEASSEIRLIMGDSSHSLTYLATRMLTDLTIGITSKEPLTQVLSVVNCVNTLFHHFDLIPSFHEIFENISKCAAEQGRHWTEGINKLKDWVLSYTSTHLSSIVPQGFPSTQDIMRKFFLDQLLRESFAYVKAKVISNCSKKHTEECFSSLLSTDQDLAILCGGVELLAKAGGAVWVANSSENALVAVRLAKLADILWAKYNMIPPPMPILNLKSIRDLAQKFSSSVTAVHGEARQGSVIVYIYGDPGQGKSWASNLLRNALNRRMGVFPVTQAFTPTTGETFFDGYVNQPIVMQNDSFFMSDKAIRFEQASMMMSAADTTPLPLKMSTTTDKGNVFYNSKIMICTSNVPLHELPMSELNLSDPTALLRRMHVYVQQFCNEPTIMRPSKNDLQIIDEAEVSRRGPFGPEIYSYRLVDPLSGNVLGVLTHQELTDHVMNLVERKSREYDESRGLSAYDAELIDQSLLKYVQQGTLPSIVKFEPTTDNSLWLSNIEQTIPGFDLSWFNWIHNPKFQATASILAVIGVLATGATLLYRYMSKETQPDIVTESRDDQFVRGGKKVAVKVSQRSKNKQEYQRQMIEQELTEFLADNFSPDIALDIGDPQIVIPESTGSFRSESSDAFVTQGCDDINTLDLISVSIVNQLYWMSFTTGDRIQDASQAFNLCDRYFLLPLHVWESFGDTFDTMILTGAKKYVVWKDLIKLIKKLPDVELAVIEIDKLVMPSGKNMLTKIVCSEELPHADGSAIITTRLGNHQHTAAFFGCARFERVSPQYIQKMNDSIPEFQIVSAYYYPTMQTFSGMCASPLVLMSKSHRGKIIGFHCAGNNQRAGGYATVVWRELFDFLKPIEVIAPSYTREPPVIVQQGFNITHNIDYRFKQHQNGKSSILRSPLYGKFGQVTRAIAKLHIDDFNDPLLDGQCKNKHQVFTIKRNDAIMIKVHISTYLRSLLRRQGIKACKTMTLEKAINGDPKYMYQDPLVMKTSAGFPFNKRRSGNKSSWFDEIDSLKVPCHALQQDLDFMDSQLHQNIPPFVVFRDTLKDEKRPIEKVREGKTRVFSAAPLDFTILFRKYYLPAIAVLSEICVEGPVSVGIDPHGPNWGHLLTHFNVIEGDLWVAGDFGNYDGSLPSCFLDIALNIMDSLYEPNEEDHKIRMCFKQSVLHPYHVTNDLLYQTESGLPSGLPGTSVINSLANMALHLWVWDQLDYPMEEFFTGTHFKFYGDDSLGKVHPAYDAFNMQTIAYYLSTIGMKYTSPLKTADIETPYMTFESITYLKRSFRYHKGVWLAPLPTHDIDDIMNWVREGTATEMDSALVSSATSVAIEFSHYNQELYDNKTTTLSALLADIGIFWIPNTYQDLRLRYRA
jgi:hypothetical protein